MGGVWVDSRMDMLWGGTQRREESEKRARKGGGVEEKVVH